jgi:hypothetical protein
MSGRRNADANCPFQNRCGYFDSSREVSPRPLLAPRQRAFFRASVMESTRSPSSMQPESHSSVVHSRPPTPRRVLFWRLLARSARSPSRPRQEIRHQHAQRALGRPRPFPNAVDENQSERGEELASDFCAIARLGRSSPQCYAPDKLGSRQTRSNGSRQ